jgi:CubicO group peptidase (beta-lactamase class C family)
MNTPRLCAFAILATSVIFGCSHPRPLLSYETVTLQESSGDSSTPEFNKEYLDQLFVHLQENPDLDNLYSVLIVKDGSLICEMYFNGYEKEQRQNVKSVTKSILSLMVGIALDKGYFTDLNQTMGELFPDYLTRPADSLKRGITLHHALTMSTGLEWYENMEWLFNISWDPNWMFYSNNTVRYVLDKDMEDVPGGHFHYSTGTSQLLAGALKRTTGKSPLDFAREHLFEPMGLDRVVWESGKDGINYGGVGLKLTPREMAMLGQLCLQQGRWNGQQLVPLQWIETSTSGQILFDKDDGPYGYHWWIRPYGYSAQGYGGQYIYVLPESNSVVVFTAKNNTPTHIRPEVVENMLKAFILPAITTAGISANVR